MTTSKPLVQFRSAWKAGCPLIAINSADPAQTLRNAISSLNGKGNSLPLVEWDCVAGMRGTNIPGQPCELGQNAAMAIAEGTPGPEMVTNPVEFLAMVARKAPEDCIVFMHGMHRMINDAPVAQALWNCRDACKPRHVTIVCLGPSIKPPSELTQDIMGLSEDLPGAEELAGILDSTFKDADLKSDLLSKEERTRAIDILRGLSAFAAEQVLATSLTKQGIDFGSLWARKVRMIEQTPGLSVWQGRESFDDLGGLSNLKSFLKRILTSGNTPIRSILYLDEVEKSLAGSAGDTSGTSQDQLSVLLKEMQDKDLPGIILVGPPGTGKSSIAKAAGNVSNAPVIACDLGAMKGSLVGESEARIRQAMSVFQAVSQGKGLAIATCNKLVALPPELKRRFALGTFYIDLPTTEEQSKIWPIWLKRYGLSTQPIPSCIEWTGAEIRACCDVAYRAGMSLLEASDFVVPVCKSAADAIQQLRTLAAGKFISASMAGTYKMPAQNTVQSSRKISV